MNVKLYPFQEELVNQMAVSGNCINNSEPGCGKTAMTIGLLDKLNSKRNLIVIPKSVLRQFEAEILRFKPDLTPILVNGVPKVRKALYEAVSDLSEYTLLTTYEQFRIDVALLVEIEQGFETWIFDEVHRLNSHTTKTHKAVANLLKYYEKKELPKPRLYGNSASILMNSPLDLFGIYNIFQPQLFPNWFRFVNTYMIRNPRGWMDGPRKDKLEQLGSIVKPYIVRTTLAEVSPHLPPHVDEIIPFDLSSQEMKLYHDIRAEMLLMIPKNDIDRIKSPMSLQTTLVKMAKLSELTDHPALIGSSGIESSKMEVLKDKLSELLTNNERKCVIFSRFARMIYLLLPELHQYNPVVIAGDVTGEARQQNITKFKSDPACRIMLMTTAGSEGISLEEAQYLIRLDTPFSIGRDIQLTGRIRRVTSTEPTFSFTLVARKTVDEHILKILEKKKIMNDLIFNWDDVKELLSI